MKFKKIVGPATVLAFLTCTGSANAEWLHKKASAESVHEDATASQAERTSAPAGEQWALATADQSIARPDYVPSSSCSEIILSQLEHSVRHGRRAQGDECEAGKHLGEREAAAEAV